MAGNLKIQIIKILNSEIIKEDDTDMSMIRSILRQKYKYGRDVLQKIGNNPLKLYDTLSRDGMIKGIDHSKLVDILVEANLKEAAEDIKNLVDEHLNTKDLAVLTMANHDARPQNLTINKRVYDEPDVKIKRARLSQSNSSQGSFQGFVSPDGVPSRDFPSFYLSKSDHFYKVDEGQHGIVAIINNFTIEGSPLYRKGTEEDERQIIDFFSSAELAKTYIVQPPAKNLNKPDFERELTKLVDLLDSKKDEIHSFFLFIMSHGEQGGVKTFYTEGEDDNSVISIDDISSKFKSCIKGKPKIIVVQACQGEADNIPDVEPDSVRDPVQHPEELGGDPDVEEVEADYKIRAPIPDAADMLIALATVKGYRSYRDKGKKGGIDDPGSWFIKSFIKQLKVSHDPKYFSTHLVDVLTEVQMQVSAKKGRTHSADSRMASKKVNVRQMPCFQSTLRKKFYLVPPKLPYNTSP